MNIQGSVCIVTGASSGIGEACARQLCDAGARVVLAARRAERLRALACDLPGSLLAPTDVTRPDEIARLVESTIETYGRVDVLVNNAGQGLQVPVAEVGLDDMRAIFELNVIAPLVGMQTVLPTMRAQGSGVIVNVSSATTLRVMPGLGGYAATKSALNMLSQVARRELAANGVKVSLVYPRLTATEFHDSLRAGRAVEGASRPHAHPPELAAEAILYAIRTEEAHVLVDDPPRAFSPETEK